MTIRGCSSSFLDEVVSDFHELPQPNHRPIWGVWTLLLVQLVRKRYADQAVAAHSFCPGKPVTPLASPGWCETFDGSWVIIYIKPNPAGHCKLDEHRGDVVECRCSS